MEAAARAGQWLFVRRGWLPVPLVAAELALGQPGLWGWAAGLALVVLGEGIRLWGVGHIGPRSRTRGGETWGLINTGPYSRVRNPLYLGNLLIFAGVGAICGWPWALLSFSLIALHYNLIVRWEESNLRQLLGEPYVEYLEKVPRWFPTGPPREGGDWDGRMALKSERSTLIAALVILAAFGVKTAL